MTTPLSPAAQAVKDTVYALPIGTGLRSRIAAALRAAVVHTQHPGSKHYRGFDNWQCDAAELLAIATELEGIK